MRAQHNRLLSVEELSQMPRLKPAMATRMWSVHLGSCFSLSTIIITALGQKWSQQTHLRDIHWAKIWRCRNCRWKRLHSNIDKDAWVLAKERGKGLRRHTFGPSSALFLEAHTSNGGMGVDIQNKTFFLRQVTTFHLLFLTSAIVLAYKKSILITRRKIDS